MCDPILVLKMRPHFSLPVVKMQPHPAAHLHLPLITKYSPPAPPPPRGGLYCAKFMITELCPLSS